MDVTLQDNDTVSADAVTSRFGGEQQLLQNVAVASPILPQQLPGLSNVWLLQAPMRSAGLGGASACSASEKPSQLEDHCSVAPGHVPFLSYHRYTSAPSLHSQ